MKRIQFACKDANWGAGVGWKLPKEIILFPKFISCSLTPKVVYLEGLLWEVTGGVPS